MTRIIADISIPLDGFVTGPAPGPDNGTGDGPGAGGAAPHAWAFSEAPDVVTSAPSEAVQLPGVGGTFATAGRYDTVTAACELAEAASEAAAPASGKALDVGLRLVGGGAAICSAFGVRRRPGRRADAAPRLRHGQRPRTTVHRGSVTSTSTVTRLTYDVLR
jgi:hypothetical protein